MRIQYRQLIITFSAILRICRCLGPGRTCASSFIAPFTLAFWTERGGRSGGADRGPPDVGDHHVPGLCEVDQESPRPAAQAQPVEQRGQVRTEVVRCPAAM